MRLTTSLNDRAVWRRLVATVRGTRWASRFYTYSYSQLRDLRPGGPTTSAPPFVGLPPPHLLLGYYYVARTMNDYLFDQRTYSSLSYEERAEPSLRDRHLHWKLLSDCSYSINTGAFIRALEDTDDFDETVHQIQNAVVMDRILSTINAAAEPIQGLGAAIRQQNSNRGGIAPRPDFATHYALSTHGHKNAEILRAICRTKKALFHFIQACNRPSPSERTLDSPLDGNWLTRLVEQLETLQVTADPANIDTVRNLALVMAIGRGPLRGGAITLRSGTRVGLPYQLRQRDGRQAVTQEIRRRRGQAIQNFIDSLPLRQRRVPPGAISDESEEPEREISVSPLQPEAVEVSRDELPGPSRSPEEEEEIEDTYNETIVATLVDLLQALEDELTPEARRSPFFRFGVEFYELMVQTINRESLTTAFVRRWLLNFFVVEHIASTLHYLQSRLARDRVARQHILINFCQVIVRGRDHQGEELFTRLWSENYTDRAPLVRLYRRILQDYLALTENVQEPHGFQAQEERDQLLQDIDFVQDSGNPEEVFRQFQVSDSDIDSVEVAIRLKTSGLVALSRNADVIASFDRQRAAAVREWRQHNLPQ
ncbi:terminal protein precursor [Psittacine adenovirus 3]|uniref:Terminal protein n=1 Tax=Psittacine adenovirus 3 TaxID=1580497 RepID=A0A0A7JTR8_9ADEN|nr:terminal protein precursor [Psittacine adenovirus 3]AIZ35766.1 terminal protein precursor [Psittacine adenovirus 3]